MITPLLANFVQSAVRPEDQIGCSHVHIISNYTRKQGSNNLTHIDKIGLSTLNRSLSLVPPSNIKY